ncbi:FCD domain-containing protein [Rhodoplanes serenus]|uniref:FCD domain-containing protein n=1 Tax=Rhodoplanes serenus TaxID=200615 RepID=A0A9X4XQM1_9BRAD|nr:FCD domain-containing protein [Rhodoplanes serenus]
MVDGGRSRGPAGVSGRTDEQATDGTGPARAPDERGPIVRQTLHDAVVSRVRDLIVDGTLASGTRIHESNLGRELGVSRTPLREALKYLASEGLIELSPGRGAVVRQFSAKDIRDSLIVLGELEGLAGRLACVHASESQIAEVAAMHARMVAMYEARDRLPYFKLNQEIHTAIVRISGNEALVDVHGIIQARLRRIRYLGHQGPENWAQAVTEHEQFVTLLRARDADGLARALAHHMDATWERVKNEV